MCGLNHCALISVVPFDLCVRLRTRKKWKRSKDTQTISSLKCESVTAEPQVNIFVTFPELGHVGNHAKFCVDWFNCFKELVQSWGLSYERGEWSSPHWLALQHCYVKLILFENFFLFTRLKNLFTFLCSSAAFVFIPVQLRTSSKTYWKCQQ